MRRKLKPSEGEGRRPRIGVSVDPEVHDWIRSFNGQSDSHTVSCLLKAAMLAGLTPGESQGGGVLEEFAYFLASQKRNKLDFDMHLLLAKFLEER